MLQTMLYLANQQSANHTLNDLYNLPPGLTPGGGLYFIQSSWNVKARQPSGPYFVIKIIRFKFWELPRTFCGICCWGQPSAKSWVTISLGESEVICTYCLIRFSHAIPAAVVVHNNTTLNHDLRLEEARAIRMDNSIKGQRQSGGDSRCAKPSAN